MNEHIAIRKETYVAGGKNSPEVGVFTQTHRGRKPNPWGRIKNGETVWMKWSGGPIVARARVLSTTELEKCTWQLLREAVGDSYRLFKLDDYWDTLAQKGTFNGVVIRLEDEHWLEKPIVTSVQNRESWVVIDSPDIRDLWFVDGVRLAADRQSGPNPPPVSPALRFEVLRRDAFTCSYCGRTPCEDGIKLHADHVVPRKSGGPTTLDNLVAACQDCNLGKGSKHL